jgi:inhibitor of cysteine peptidase
VTLFARDATGDQKLTATADASGRFAFTNVHPGTVSVDAREGEQAASRTVEITVGSGDRADGLRLALQPAVALTGRVVDGAGNGVAAVRVTARQTASHAPLPPVSTGSDGTFSIAGTIDTDYELSVRDPNSPAVARASGRPGAPVEITLAAPGGIHGTVSGGSDVTVAVDRFVPEGATSRGRPAVTSASFTGDGFTLSGLAAGTYDLRISAAGRAPTSVAGVAVQGGQVSEVQVTLVAGARLSGTVTDPQGAVAGARVVVDGGGTAFTDAQGRFAIDDVPLGDVTVTVSDSAGHSARRKLQIGADGATLQLEIAA